MIPLFSGMRFLWQATAGYRVRPWRSPYLRWRFETYTGKPAGSIRLSDFLNLLISERRQILRFFTWVGAMGRISAGKRP